VQLIQAFLVQNKAEEAEALAVLVQIHHFLHHLAQEALAE
jgi:hypothetical protein